ncbi:unnamed protein product [Schistosoma mansoni]|uniref:Smp_204640 n=1 Tax=Schistosoma mansoni TaxID=6183 RepID=UPI00022C8506|nr:unnamed protein product [Schistosoma mansoni]|eukprot:XP_018646509.1 unnamed protein product [Schistosoma mansoni]
MRETEDPIFKSRALCHRCSPLQSPITRARWLFCTSKFLLMIWPTSTDQFNCENFFST